MSRRSTPGSGEAEAVSNPIEAGPRVKVASNLDDVPTKLDEISSALRQQPSSQPSGFERSGASKAARVRPLDRVIRQVPRGLIGKRGKGCSEVSPRFFLRLSK